MSAASSWSRITSYNVCYTKLLRYLLLDFAPYMRYAGTLRQVRDILQRRNCLPHVLVLVGHKIELPEDLEAYAVRYRPHLPTSYNFV